MQDVAAELDWYLPLAHAMHSEASEAALLPGVHARHTVEPTAATEPEEQASHCVRVECMYLPTPHCVQEAAALPEIDPSWHVLQPIAPVLLWYCPARQPLQERAPVASWYWPAGHLVHCPWPVLGL